MIGSKFAEQYVESDRPCALLREFVHNAAIHLARPIEPKMKTDGAVPNRANTIFIDVNEAEIGGDARGKNEALASPNVVGDAFEALEKLESKEAEKANEQDNSQSDQTRNEFERLGFHDAAFVTLER
jgi:hypothetical protein